MADDTSVGNGLLIPRQKSMAKTANLGPDEVEYDNITYKICMTELTTYRISVSHVQEHGALVDHSTNSGIAGADCCIIEMEDQVEHYVNIEGIGDQVITKRCLVLVGAITQSN
jgi:hypothetical protein